MCVKYNCQFIMTIGWSQLIKEKSNIIVNCYAIIESFCNGVIHTLNLLFIGC